MGITLLVDTDHLPVSLTTEANRWAQPCNRVVIPGVDPDATVHEGLKEFLEETLGIPQELQQLSAPSFACIADDEHMSDVYGRYACNSEMEETDLHLDEETYALFGRESSRRFAPLSDGDRLSDRHLLDGSVLQLKEMPRPLPEEGGRLFVETKEGILPLMGVQPTTLVRDVKDAVQTLLEIPMRQQILSSAGRVMHDDLRMIDFAGPHAIQQDGVIDLCLSGDTNKDQSHRRLLVNIAVGSASAGEESTISIVCQGRDTVANVTKHIEEHLGIPLPQQRLTIGGKAMEEKKALGEYFVTHECTLRLNVVKGPPMNVGGRSPSRPATASFSESGGASPAQRDGAPAARKIKLMRTGRGRVLGSVTLPVLSRDRVRDMKRKVQRYLQPLLESDGNNANVVRTPTGLTHVTIVPRPSNSPYSPSPEKPPSHTTTTTTKASATTAPASACEKKPTPPLKPPTRTAEGGKGNGPAVEMGRSAKRIKEGDDWPSSRGSKRGSAHADENKSPVRGRGGGEGEVSGSLKGKVNASPRREPSENVHVDIVGTPSPLQAAHEKDTETGISSWLTGGVHFLKEKSSYLKDQIANRGASLMEKKTTKRPPV